MADVTLINAGRLGAQVPMHDRNMEQQKRESMLQETLLGVKEASSAIEEGKLAGIAAAEALGKLSKEEAAKAKENVWNSLDQLRTGPFGQGRHDAKEQIIEQMEEWKVKNSAC